MYSLTELGTNIWISLFISLPSETLMAAKSLVVLGGSRWCLVDCQRNCYTCGPEAHLLGKMTSKRLGLYINTHTHTPVDTNTHAHTCWGR